ncbi:MAG: DNA polymerase IV [Synergistaceae bacterium]|nr:DNA polymerase IV [Synergistaceae bacterium]
MEKKGELYHNAVRKVIHVDLDAFYASIEQRDHPEYRGRPLAVGYAAERGVVATASYEARKFGVHSAMPSLTALSKCPQIIFVPARFDVYREISRQIRGIFMEYTDLVEPLSLDEAYLDVTENKPGMASATLIAREIKKRIRDATGLTASAGVSVNKFLAKVASDWNKPDGIFVILPEEAEAFAEELKIEKFWGVGKVTAARMRELGIHTGRDLKRFGENELVRLFGKAGHTYYLNARGIDEREVVPDRARKSLGAEETFLTDIGDRTELEGRLRDIADELWRRVAGTDFYGRTVTLKIKYADFREVSKRRTCAWPIRDFRTFWSAALDLLACVEFGKERKVRLMGLSVSNAERNESEARQRYLDFGEDDP